MAVSDLNIALRLNDKEFTAGMRRMESALKESTSRLTGIGNSMAVAFTAPLALIGGAAIKASGEFEQLQRALEATMSGAGYSIAQTADEMERLREIAKAPGLDFKEAVQGSISLQAVGLSAEMARKTIAEFANGVAAAGGTAQNLSGVTAQLAQMIAKGKVLAQDLKIIKENMPSISTAMVKAFGTADAEGIQKLNISADEFVKKITEELAKAPRVVGGLANAMVNAQAAITQAAVRLGDTLNKTFNITGALDNFSNWVTEMADRFGALDDSTQKAIIGVGIFVAALGPAIRIGGAMVGAISKMQIAMQTLQAVMARSETATIGLGNAFSKLSLATKLTILGAAVGVILAAAAAFKLMSSEVSAGAEAQKIFADATKETNTEAAKEVAVLNKNIDVLKNANSSTHERNAAIKELKAAYPDYLRGMDLEKLSIAQLDELQKGLNASILRGVAERKKAAAINQIYEKQADLILRVRELQKGAKLTPSEAILVDTGEMIRAGSTANAVIIKLQAQIKGLGEEAVKSGKAFDSAFGLNSDTYMAASGYDDDYEAAAEKLNKLNSGAKTFSDNTTKAADGIGKIKDKMDDIAKTLPNFEKLPSRLIPAISGRGKASATAPLNPLKGGINAPLGNTEFGVALSQVSSLTSGLGGLAKQLDITSEAWIKYKSSVDESILAVSRMNEKKEALMEITYAVGNAVIETAQSGKAAIADYARAAVRAAAKVIGAKIQQGVTEVVASAVASAPYPFNLILGPAAGIAANAIFQAAIARATAPKLAQGGIAYGPVMAMVGDNPGARFDPEVIAPLSKLSDIIKDNAGAGRVEVYGRLSGTDMYISNREIEKRFKRFT